jgi:hypothetical protein
MNVGLLNIFIVFSFGQDLLSCILDIVDIPKVAKDSEIDEDDFRRILDWCDIWIILLKTTGKTKYHALVFFLG